MNEWIFLEKKFVIDVSKRLVLGPNVADPRNCIVRLLYEKEERRKKRTHRGGAQNLTRD